jgi:hypothetical protein
MMSQLLCGTKGLGFRRPAQSPEALGSIERICNSLKARCTQQDRALVDHNSDCWQPLWPCPALHPLPWWWCVAPGH